MGWGIESELSSLSSGTNKFYPLIWMNFKVESSLLQADGLEEKVYNESHQLLIFFNTILVPKVGI